MKASKKKSPKDPKEMMGILKRISPDLERLIDLAEGAGDGNAAINECVRSGARSLLVARRFAKKR